MTLRQPIGLALLLIGLTLGCRTEESAPRPELAKPRVTRGEHVVMERGGGEFLEAVVLETLDSRVRIQRLDGAGSETVSMADIYTLPPKPEPLKTGDYSICNTEGELWVACRILQSDNQGTVVSTLRGEEKTLPRQRILLPNDLTALNLKGRFQKTAERSEFHLALQRVGAPRASPRWHPSPGQRVIALRNQQWFSARVREVDDAVLFVDWVDTGRSNEVPRPWVAAEPPYDFSPQRGAFALLRPAVPSAPWTPVRIVNSVSEDTVRVADDANEKRNVPTRDLVPIN